MDSELEKNKQIFIDSLVKILKTTNNSVFKYKILAKLKLNHLSNDNDIDKSLNGLLDNFLHLNSMRKHKKFKKDDEFDGLNANEDQDEISSNFSSISMSSIESDFGDLGGFETIFKPKEQTDLKERDLTNIVKENSSTIDYFDLLGNENTVISKNKNNNNFDDFESLSTF
jgi:hypothetical protein